MKNLSKFVDILSSGGYSAADVCLHLAKTDPELFMAIVDITNEKRKESLPQWVQPLVNEIRHVGFISSIKMLRDFTGLSLKEAKETIENLINYRLSELGERSYYDVSPKPHHTLNKECDEIFDLVAEGFERY